MEDRPSSSHPARILVSSTRKPISYLNLCKRFLQEHGELQLSALGIAIAPMVTLAEILKGRGLAVEKRLSTSLETLSDDNRSRQKSKLEIVLSKSPDFDQIIADEESERAQAPRSHQDQALVQGLEDGFAGGLEDGSATLEDGSSSPESSKKQ